MEEIIHVQVELPDATDEELGALNRDLYDYVRDTAPEVEARVPPAEPVAAGAKGISLAFVSGIFVKLLSSAAVKSFLTAMQSFLQRHRKLSLTLAIGDHKVTLDAENVGAPEVMTLLDYMVERLKEISAPAPSTPQPG